MKRIVVVALLACTLVMSGCSKNIEENIDSTEVAGADDYMDAFGGESETEVENDAEPVYTWQNVDRYQYSDEEIPEYMRKLQEEQKIDTEQQEFKAPNFTYIHGDIPQVDPTTVLISENTWYYVESGTAITVDGVTADNVPTGMYFNDTPITGAASKEDAPVLDISKENTGYYLGGTNLDSGKYRLVSGIITEATTYIGLQGFDDKITYKYAGSSATPDISSPDDDYVHIYDNAYYHLKNCVLEKVE